MMEEWSDWVVDNDPAEMIRQMRGVLADRNRSQEDKLEALTLLTNLADDQSVAVLRWYHEHADPGMELTALLALIEASRLNQPPEFEPWHDQLLEKIHNVGETLFEEQGVFPLRAAFSNALSASLRAEGWRVEKDGHALLKYDGHLIDLTPLDLIINGRVLIGFWDQADEEAGWSDLEEEEPIDPMDRFYAALRSANLPWGIQVDISGDTIFTDMVENSDVDRGTPRVEYILSMPRN